MLLSNRCNMSRMSPMPLYSTVATKCAIKCCLCCVSFSLLLTKRWARPSNIFSLLSAFTTPFLSPCVSSWSCINLTVPYLSGCNFPSPTVSPNCSMNFVVHLVSTMQQSRTYSPPLSRVDISILPPTKPSSTGNVSSCSLFSPLLRNPFLGYTSTPLVILTSMPLIGEDYHPPQPTSMRTVSNFLSPYAIGMKETVFSPWACPMEPNS